MLPGILLALGACGHQTNDDTPVETGAASVDLEVALVVEVQESDSLYLGAPSAFAINPATGHFWVADRFHGHIIEIGRDGVIRRRIGNKGEGPGEFRIPRAILVQDSVLFVADAMSARLTWFSLPDGSLLGTRNIVSGIPSDLDATSGALMIGSLSRADSFGVVKTIPMGSRSDLRFARMPDHYLALPSVSGIFTSVFVAAWADTVAVMYQASDTVRLYAGADLKPAGKIPFIPLLRRGVTQEGIRGFNELSFPEMFARFSAGFLLHRMPDGRLLTVHLDQEIVDRDATNITAWVSWAHPSAGPTCSDRKITFPDPIATQPRFSARGDTLFVLSQSVDSIASTALIRGLIIPQSRCSPILQDG